jgi:hypothetical protein
VSALVIPSISNNAGGRSVNARLKELQGISELKSLEVEDLDEDNYDGRTNRLSDSDYLVHVTAPS